MENKTQFSMLK